MKKKQQTEDESHKYAHLSGVLHYHEKMLTDSVRNKLLYQILEKYVTPETKFLDIGAGTGVWAILAAKLGARRVVAVEIEETLIPIIHRHAKENGVAHKIEIIHGNSNDLKIREKFDLIISELFSLGALGAEVVHSFIYLRDRFLAKNGVLVPQKLTFKVAPVKLKQTIQNIPAELPLKCGFMQSLRYNFPRSAELAERSAIELLGTPQSVLELDFTTIEEPKSLENLSAVWELDRIDEINAFLTFTESTFDGETVMSSLDSQSWSVTLYEIQPISQKTGTVKFSLTFNQTQSFWSVSLPSSPEVKPQSFSNALAYAHLKMSRQMTPFRKLRPARTPKPKPAKK